MCMFSVGDGTQSAKRQSKRGMRMTLEETLEHVGGIENLLSAEAMAELKAHAKDYIWQYNAKTDGGNAYCTACGTTFEPERYVFHEKHGSEIECPACGKPVTYRHVAKGHKRCWDQFVFYEWRVSVIDPETVVLTAAHVWRDSTKENPENAPLNIARSAIYVMKPGCPVTIYKRSPWNAKEPVERDFIKIHNIAPEHTRFGMLEHTTEFCETGLWNINNTRIYRTYEEIIGGRNWTRMDTFELRALSNAARWPWLEYLAKSGQRHLAEELLREERAPKEIIKNQRAKNLRGLLGLTEAQAYEIKRDKLVLNAEDLSLLRVSERLGAGFTLGEIQEIRKKNGSGNGWYAHRIEREFPKLGAHMPEKLRRKTLRRMLRDLRNSGDYLDYLDQLDRLSEDMTDTALILPKDLHAMHQRMTERLNAIYQAEREELERQKQARFTDELLPRLRKLYTFRACGLELRPFETASEIVNEGKVQHICIGSYVERYMEGGTVICCLRRAEEPDEPWRAVEFEPKTGRLVQDRGYKNDRPNGSITEKAGIDPGTQKLLKKFWSEFEAWRKSA